MTKPRLTEYEKIILGCIGDGRDPWRGVHYGMSSGHTTGAIRRLVKKGYVVPDEEKMLSGYRSKYNLTAAGTEVLKEVLVYVTLGDYNKGQRPSVGEEAAALVVLHRKGLIEHVVHYKTSDEGRQLLLSTFLAEQKDGTVG